MRQITYERVVAEVRKACPNLGSPSITEISLLSDTPHVYFDLFVCPGLRELIMADAEDELRMVFDFFERLSGAADERIRTLMQASVYESLAEDPSILMRARRLMGPEFTALAAEYHRWLGRDE